MYRVIVADPAERELERLEGGMRRRVIQAMAQLAKDPLRKTNVKKLAGSDFFRLQVGNYRIVFDKDVKNRLIRIITLGHRKEVYR